VRLVCWPPSGPESNPIERGGRNRQATRVWRQGPKGKAPPDYLAALLRGDAAVTVHSLTGYPYPVQAIDALRV